MVESPSLEVVRKQRDGTWEQGLMVNTVVLGYQLDSTILEVFSNLNNSETLTFHATYEQKENRTNFYLRHK